MGLKTWWIKRQETLAKEELCFFLEAYLKEYQQSPTVQRKAIARQFFPRAGQDLLRQKELFLREYSIHEHEFRKKYLIKKKSDHFMCRYSLEIEEKSRLAAHKKWREMICQFQNNQKSKTR